LPSELGSISHRAHRSLGDAARCHRISRLLRTYVRLGTSGDLASRFLASVTAARQSQPRAADHSTRRAGRAVAIPPPAATHGFEPSHSMPHAVSRRVEPSDSTRTATAAWFRSVPMCLRLPVTHGCKPCRGATDRHSRTVSIRLNQRRLPFPTDPIRPVVPPGTNPHGFDPCRGATAWRSCTVANRAQVPPPASHARLQTVPRCHRPPLSHGLSALDSPPSALPHVRVPSQ